MSSNNSKSDKVKDISRFLKLEKESVPALGDMIQSIIGRFGTLEDFADRYYSTFTEAKPGSLARSRMLERVLDLVRVHHQISGHDGETFEDVSDEELQALFHEEFESELDDDSTSDG